MFRTCPHCGSRYRVPAKARTKPRLRLTKVAASPDDDLSKEMFRASSWLHFWTEAGEPDWRASHFLFQYGDGLVPDDRP